MKLNDNVSIIGYDIVARAACDFGAVLVLNNNSTHYIVVETEIGGEDLDAQGKHTTLYNPTARVVGIYQYGNAEAAYRMALEKMVEQSMHLTSFEDEDPEACPGCGSQL